jgi:hypothetical protein
MAPDGNGYCCIVKMHQEMALASGPCEMDIFLLT